MGSETATFCSVHWYTVLPKVPVTTRNMHCSILYRIMTGYKQKRCSRLTGHRGKYAEINWTESCTSYHTRLYFNTLFAAFWPWKVDWMLKQNSITTVLTVLYLYISILNVNNDNPSPMRFVLYTQKEVKIIVSWMQKMRIYIAYCQPRS